MLPLQEAILASRMMTMMAGKVTEGLSSFSSWLMGGFIVVFAFLLSHLDTISEFLPPAALGAAGKIFLAALALHVIQRYLAFIVNAAVAAAKESEALPPNEEVNFGLVMQEIENSTFWPARILVRINFAKVRAGDFAASGRMMAKLAQAQGILVIAQLCIVIGASNQIVRAL